MRNFFIGCEWVHALSNEPAEIRATAAQITFEVGGVNLTRAEDLWSKTVVPSVLVSAYPLALWLASSWWRLLYEPVPPLVRGALSDADWRMSHEVAAAGHGFVWPTIALAGDGSVVQFWASADAATDTEVKSVVYIDKLSAPFSVPREEFVDVVSSFINTTVARLRQEGVEETPLDHLWGFIRDDAGQSEVVEVRRIEAALGFDAEECPDDLLADALDFSRKLGYANFLELAPAFRVSGRLSGIEGIKCFLEMDSLRAKLNIPKIDYEKVGVAGVLPWEKGVKIAKLLRSQVLPKKPLKVSNVELCKLLGLDGDQPGYHGAIKGLQASVGIPAGDGEFKLIIRKKPGDGRRFEYARLIGDSIFGRTDFGSSGGLTSTDLGTSRQKMQRAFAAEFLCPIDRLVDSLSGDFSETAIENAANRFGVSEKTVEYQLMNNHVIPSAAGCIDFPYRLAS